MKKPKEIKTVEIEVINGKAVEVPIFAPSDYYSADQVVYYSGVSRSQWLKLRKLLVPIYGSLPSKLSGRLVTHLLRHGEPPKFDDMGSEQIR